jgi:hypothetical protein
VHQLFSNGIAKSIRLESKWIGDFAEDAATRLNISETFSMIKKFNPRRPMLECMRRDQWKEWAIIIPAGQVITSDTIPVYEVTNLLADGKAR